MVAVLGFTTILGSFSVIGIWARLPCGRVVLDVPFNPTYGLTLKSCTPRCQKLRFFVGSNE